MNPDKEYLHFSNSLISTRVPQVAERDAPLKYNFPADLSVIPRIICEYICVYNSVSRIFLLKRGASTFPGVL